MKSNELLNEIGGIDEQIIEEAETICRKSKAWMRRTAAAAVCIAVIAAAVITKPTEPPAALLDLPFLTIGGENMGSYGFEGFMAYDISELDSSNPWTQDDLIETLPVFMNPTKREASGVIINGLSEAEMTRKVYETAEAMGLPVDSVTTYPTAEELQKMREKVQSIPGEEDYEPYAAPTEVQAACGDVTIRVDGSGAVRIFFNSGVRLPSEYSFTYFDTNEQQANDVMWYLLEEYRAIVNMISPALSVSGDYTYDGQRRFDFVAYENSGSLTDRILGFSFNSVKFSPDADGLLWIIDRSSYDLSQKLGDYPIISLHEAKRLFAEKHFITTVPAEYPQLETASVELMYRTDAFGEVFMPYYRFLVELDTSGMIVHAEGLKTFGAFYVPAVESTYLTNMPLWDGRFN